MMTDPTQKSDQPRTTLDAVRAERISRRGFIKRGIGGAAAVGAVASASAGDNPHPQLRAPAFLQQSGGIAGLAGGYDPDLVLLIDRITGGFSVAEYERAEGLGGYDAYLAEQLDPVGNNLIGPANDPELWSRLQDGNGDPYDIVDKTAKQIWLDYKDNNQSFQPMAQLTSIQVMFATYAKAQLFYRMFQFWNHHLNIEVLSSTTQRFILWPFLRDVVLANAMGNFGQLILDSAHGAAMLLYLNNYTNRAGNIDENYARELLELHTLGVDNGYDETDIHEAARILTGWSACFGDTCSDSYGTYDYGEFWFRPNRHDVGPDKVVMGQTFPSQTGLAGENEAIDLIHFLTALPNCADFVARKLCRFFLGGLNFNYDPPEDIVQVVSWTYLNNGTAIGDIPSMLAVLLQKDVLTQYAVPKLRRPFDLLTATLRGVQAEVDPEAVSGTNLLRELREDLELMGMHPQYWGPPDGPADSQAWSQGGLLSRWNYQSKLADNGAPEVANFTVGVGGLLDLVGATAAEAAQGLNELLTGGRMEPKEVAAVGKFLGPNPSELRLKEGLALAMQLPTYQFH
jgi:uncharacterized protein (DUF1800 family)